MRFQRMEYPSASSRCMAQCSNMRPEKLLVAHWTAAVGAALLVVYLLPAEAADWGLPILGRFWMPLKGAIAFGLLGLLQGSALSLARPLPLAAWSAVAGVLIMLGVRLVGPDADAHSIPARAGIGAATGVVLGCLQGIALRGLIRQLIVWPLVLSLAWGLGYTVEAAVIAMAGEVANADQQFALAAAGGTLACMIIGGISGIAILKLTRPGAAHDPTRRTDETGEEHRR
jgi:hypothetical protein